jgi:3-mercaptopyruvate sulfurtransferase SseA
MAQYKTQPQPQAAQPGTIQITPNNAPTSTAAIVDELATAKRIDRDDAMKLVKHGKAVYIDVRSKDSYDMGHLPGAINLPLSQLQARYKELPLKKYLITYCA